MTLIELIALMFVVVSVFSGILLIITAGAVAADKKIDFMQAPIQYPALVYWPSFGLGTFLGLWFVMWMILTGKI